MMKKQLEYYAEQINEFRGREQEITRKITKMVEDQKEKGGISFERIKVLEEQVLELKKELDQKMHLKER